MNPVYREGPAGPYDYYRLLFDDTALVERRILQPLPVCSGSSPRRRALFFKRRRRPLRPLRLAQCHKRCQ